MADRPLSGPLPADLPEDWTSGQTIAPAGADVGLSEQHGYNYLMAAVNRAQQAVNAINEGFDAISVKQANRVVVGTSTAGWTEDDCDFLCDGTDDHVEIQAAIEASKEGDEIYFLSGNYFVDEPIYGILQSLTGSGVNKTTLEFSASSFSAGTAAALMLNDVTIKNMTLYCKNSSISSNSYMLSLNGACSVRNVYFVASSNRLIMSIRIINGATARISDCLFGGDAPYNGAAPDIYMNRSAKVFFVNNYISKPGFRIYFPDLLSCVISGNAGGLSISGELSESIISNNFLTEINLNGGYGTIITGNSFGESTQFSDSCINLGSDTKNMLVTGNNLRKPNSGTSYNVSDSGTNNIIRFNSNDTGGSGTAGVTSFKGRSGAVLPQSGDYTAAMVGAIPTGTVAAIQGLTQAEYDALATKDPSTLYLIEG